ncbi:retrovirus-related Pol polyprotein from transposon TNT 1-94 [Trichonephila clavipes]|nr:retrovirus-related Pol polyprotein from transposon TNT 1-94 [Trichonephila clavipes]
MAKEPVWFKNISPEVMDIYLADKNSKMMSQGTGNVSAKTVSTKHCNSINLTITDVSYVPQLRSKYENLTDKRIKKIRTDNGESNGKAERANRVLLERARSLLYESKLPLKFWAEAINCSTQVSNVTPRKGKEKIPLEIWTGEIENETWDIDSFFEVSPERNEINQNTENGVLYNFDINNGPGAIENDNSIPFQTTSSPRQAESKFRLKQDDAGKNIKYKARLVAAGFNQIKNIDYSESYSPVVNIESFRLLIALAAKLKLNVNFFDVKTAYLYGDLEETVYVLPPPGYEKLIGDDKVCKLKKSIYANRTRPDISFVISYLSQFNHNPEKRHYNLAKRVLRYLMGSKDKKLFYENEFGILNASSDASWGNAENGKSFSGGVVLLGNSLILWKCRKQKEC